MPMSDKDSENLQRIADALDPPSYDYSSPSPPPWPWQVRALIGAFVGAFLSAIPAGLVAELIDRTAGNILFFLCVVAGAALWIDAG